MNITESLKQDLISEFKSEKKLTETFSNFELYKFTSLNQNQLLKLYNLESQNIYTESNAKKHLQKVQEMIKSNFLNDNTDKYFNLFFQPTNNLAELKKRRDIISKILNLTQMYQSKQKELKEKLSKLVEFNTKISFSKSIYTIDGKTSKYFYENYFLNIIEITRKDLEQMQNEENSDFILLSEEHLHIENDQYTLKDFEKIVFGNIIKKNKTEITNLIEIYNIISNDFLLIKQISENLTNKKIEFNLNLNDLKQTLEKDNTLVLKELSKKANTLNIEVEKINKELKEKISTKKVSLEGDELLALLNSGNVQAIANKLKQETSDFISTKEKELLEEYKKHKININYIFESHTYPLKIDENIKEELIQKIDSKIKSAEYDLFLELGKYNINQISTLNNLMFFFDMIFGISKFSNEYNLEFANITNEFKLINTKNIYVENASPINYGIGISKINEINLGNEKISVLTGANSGGKTTLLEMFLQSQILTNIGFGISGDKTSSIFLVDEVIYLKKFTGTQGSGAFEQTIRNLIEILDSKTTKLILIDEFEAITEPGAAAKILIGFLEELSKQNNFAIAVSHLGKDIQSHIKENNVTSIRIDGISAVGLDEKGNLLTNHQPEFNTLGKSTPELILKRIINDEKFWQGKDKNTKLLLQNILK